MDGGKHIGCELSIGGFWASGAVGAAKVAQIDGQDLIAGGEKLRNLRSPAFLGESSAVDQEKSASAGAVEVGGDDGAVVGWK